MDGTTLTASTPLSGTSRGKPSKDDQHDGQPKGTGAKVKPSVMNQVRQAIETVGVERKGASLQAIQKYILSNNAETDSKRLRKQINKALLKGIDTGVLSRPTVSKESTGVRGYFKINKPDPKTKDGKKRTDTLKKQTASKEQVSDAEAIAKKAIKPKKLNLSDEVEKNPKAAKPKGIKKNPSKPVGRATVREEKNIKVKVTKPVKGTMKKGKAESRERKDASDSEVVVNKKNRKSLKSYSSDTEVSTMVADKKLNMKARKRTESKAASAKSKAPEQSPKSKGTKKLFRENEDKPVKKPVKGKT